LFLGGVHARRLVAETDLRLLHTGRLLEDLAGQRTRRVQAPSEGDPRMDAYRQAGAAADRTTALVSVGPARIWQVLALGPSDCPSSPRIPRARSWQPRSAASCSPPPGCAGPALRDSV
jgi:hypothetical protein